MFARFLGVLAAAAVLAASAPARAEKPRWREEWPKFRVSEGIVTGVSAAGLITLYAFPPREPKRGGGILFDDAVRDALKSETEHGKTLAANLSTVGYYGLMLYPLVVDGTVAAVRGGSEVALQMTLINLQAFAVSGFVFRISEVAVARARPHVHECLQRTGGDYAQCEQSGLGGTNSFVGGHVTMAATGAALMCTHHLHLKLYGSIGSPIACGVAIAASIGVGVGRIVSDDHYATDTLAGITVGVLSGWLMPTVLHYGWNNGRAPATTRFGAPIPLASRTMLGVGWVGIL